MKHSWRDYSTIIMAFAAVFLCGYGIGHLVGERRAPPDRDFRPSESQAWERETLQSLQASLNLRPEQTSVVEAELANAARAIRESHDAVLLDYHRHLDRLYQRLIEVLDEEQAAHLRAEKNSLENRIKQMSTN